MQNNGLAGALGSIGLTMPLWFERVDMMFQAIIAVLGFVVLVLTIWNKWLEIKIKRAKIEDMEEAEHGETRKD